MSDLNRACDQLGAGVEQVVKHRYEEGALVLLINYGIKGIKKYRVPVADLAEPDVYVCEGCGREFDTPQGKGAHQRFCDVLVEEEE